MLPNWGGPSSTTAAALHGKPCVDDGMRACQNQMSTCRLLGKPDQSTPESRQAASPVTPTHAQHCVFNLQLQLVLRLIRPLRQRRHSNARSSRSTSDVCVRQNPGGALARVLAQTPTRRPAGSLVQPACNCKYVHKLPHQTRGWRAIAGPPGWGAPHKTKVPTSVLQSGTFFADFLQRVLLDIPPDLSGGRVGFEFGFEQDSSTYQVTYRSLGEAG